MSSPDPSRTGATRAVLALAAVVVLLAAVIGTPRPAGAAATPSSTLAGLGDRLIGEEFTFTATFDNTGTDTGYAPFIDLLFPRNGADGSAGADTPDGIEFIGVDYLGLPVRVDRLPVPDDDGAGPGTTGTVEHPLTGELITATAGDELVVLSAPFGSFAPGQPAADLAVTARLSPLADAGVPLGIGQRSGFALGETPLDDPATDPPLLGDTDTDATTWSTTDVVPTVLLLDKEYLGPEQETATGPNFPRQYRITVDLPDGQTVTDLDLVDAFPDELAFLAVDSITPAGTVVAAPPVGVSSTGSTLEVNVPTVTGTAAPDDVVVLVSFFVDRLDGSGAEVVDSTSGAAATITNAATALGDWDPVDGRDDASPDNVAAGPVDDSFTARAVATQKSVRNLTDGTNSPGDLLEYTIDVQVSDHLALDGLVVEDVLSDGQRLDPTFVPSMAVSGASSSPTAAMSQVDVTDRWSGAPVPVAPLDGTTRLAFRISDELAQRGLDPALRGGCVPPGGTGGPAVDCGAENAGATTVRIVMRTVIQAEFSDDAPTGDASVDQGDLLDNTITVSGDLLDAADLAPTGGAPTDTGSAGLAIAEGGFTKGLYRVNGAAPGDPATIAPGDEVTWRLTYRHPTSGFEDFVLEDFLPLPAFDATEVTTFDAGTVSAAAPAAGTAHYHPDDTFRLLPGAPAPGLSTDAGDNALSFDYGTFDVDPAAESVMDVLFTVTATDQPLADQLLLTNIAQSSSSNTNGAGQVATDGVQVELTEPELTVTKGVVATDAVAPEFTPDPPAPAAFSAPGGADPRHTGTIASDDLAATPIDANLTAVDAGDLVTFALTVENTGSGTNGAFDVTVSDDLPAGFVVPAGGINLGVVDGTGATLAVSELAGGLLGSGVRLDDGSDTGSLGPFDPTAGTNLAIITYDLEVAGSVEPGSTLTNTASLDRYAGTEGGPNHLDEPATDDAEVVADEPTIAKSLVATSEPHTDGAGLAVGEIARFRIEVVVPEGTSSDASITDELPAGLAFLDDGTATVALVSDGGAGLASSTLTGAGLGLDGDGSTVDAITPTIVVPSGAISGGAGDGADVTIDLGTLTNADDDADTELVVVELNALVRNAATATAGASLENRASFDWATGSTGPSDPVGVSLVESSLGLDKAATPAAGADAGDTVTYTFGLSNESGVDAFDASLLDTVDPRIIGPTVDAIVPAGGASGIVDNSAGSTVDVDVASMPAGSSVLVTVSGALAASVEPGDAIPNTATLVWTSLPGDGTASNPTGSTVPGDAGDDDGERDGSGGVNDLRVTATAQLAVAGVTATKSIVATSEAHTTGSSVAVGEIVRYRLVAMLPEGTATAVTFVDLLPNGLRALTDGTARVALVSDSVPITSSTLADPPLGGLVAVGDETTIDAVTPVATLPPGALSAGPGSGADLTVSLGDLTNAERDADDEFVVVEFNALVDNTAVNDDGTTRNNRFRVQVDGATAATSPNVPVTVREPRLTLAKTFPGAASPDAGDTVPVRIVATNAGSATAFEPVLSDALPAGMTPQPPVSVTVPAGVTVLDDTVSGDTVTVALDRLAPGQSVTVEFDVVLDDDIAPAWPSRTPPPPDGPRCREPAPSPMRPGP